MPLHQDNTSVTTARMPQGAARPEARMRYCDTVYKVTVTLRGLLSCRIEVFISLIATALWREIRKKMTLSDDLTIFDDFCHRPGVFTKVFD